MTTPKTVLHGPIVNFSQNQIGIKRLNDTQNSLWNNNWTNRVTIIESMLLSGQHGTISTSQAQLLTTKTISPTNISQNVHKTSKKCRHKQKKHQKMFLKHQQTFFMISLLNYQKICGVYFQSGIIQEGNSEYSPQITSSRIKNSGQQHVERNKILKSPPRIMQLSKERCVFETW